MLSEHGEWGPRATLTAPVWVISQLRWLLSAAALNVSLVHGAQVQEQKGLDMVRRDWCPLSKDVGNFALREILSAKPKEEVVAAIHDHLHKVGPPPLCCQTCLWAGG